MFTHKNASSSTAMCVHRKYSLRGHVKRLIYRAGLKGRQGGPKAKEPPKFRN